MCAFISIQKNSIFPFGFLRRTSVSLSTIKLLFYFESLIFFLVFFCTSPPFFVAPMIFTCVSSPVHRLIALTWPLPSSMLARKYIEKKKNTHITNGVESCGSDLWLVPGRPWLWAAKNDIEKLKKRMWWVKCCQVVSKCSSAFQTSWGTKLVVALSLSFSTPERERDGSSARR